VSTHDEHVMPSRLSTVEEVGALDAMASARVLITNV
jgi:hypothetical protein